MTASTWVRARDGALYRDPIVTIAEGHIAFQEGVPVLVLWTPSTIAPTAILEREFGRNGWGSAPGGPVQALVPIPGMPSAPPHEASVFRFHLGRRIPVPAHHGGTERYQSRLRGDVHFLDFPPDPRDYQEIG